MFKLAKYYFIFTLLGQSKRNILAFVVSLALFIIAVNIFSDLIAISHSRETLIMAKWIVLLLLLAVMAYHLMQIYKRARLPFTKEDASAEVDVRRERIVSKEHLVSKQERILNKYRGKNE